MDCDRLVVNINTKFYKIKTLFNLMKRTKDGRFIEKRVLIDKTLLKKIMLDIKIKKSLNWNELAKKLGVCSQMLKHDWLKEKYTLPASIFKKLELLNENKIPKLKIVKPFWGQKLKDGKLKHKVVNIPNSKDVKFAEF